MSWGGARIGAGRPAKSQQDRWLAGDAGKRGQRGAAPESPEPGDQSDVDLEPSAILSEAEAAYWNLWAPLAVSTGTLTNETRPAFALLCQVSCRAARLWAQIEVDGFLFDKFSHDFSGQTAAGEGDKAEPAVVMEPKAHPLLTQYRGLISRQEQLMARYGLAGSGKAVGPAKEKPKADPFEAHQNRAKLRAVK